MGDEEEKVMYLKKTISWREVSNNQFIQILIVVIAMYITVNSYQHRTEFDACYENGTENLLHESQQSLKIAKDKGSDAETSYRLKVRLNILNACTPKD
jgi:hypothetical protein